MLAVILVDLTINNEPLTDIANAFADPATIRKLVLLTDCTSNVGGFDFLGQQFIADLTKKGMRLETSDSFLA